MILINNPWNALRMTLHWISNRMTYYYFTATKDLLCVVLRSSVSLLVLMLTFWSDWAWGAWGEVDTAVEPQFKLEPNGQLHPTIPFFFPQQPTYVSWAADSSEVSHKGFDGPLYSSICPSLPASRLDLHADIGHMHVYSLLLAEMWYNRKRFLVECDQNLCH